MVECTLKKTAFYEIRVTAVDQARTVFLAFYTPYSAVLLYSRFEFSRRQDAVRHYSY